ncbi:MAG: recombinase RecT [Paludibacteraceae bacterium]|nr:recombinase RecT [Paludibacteraceae bacterium]
MANQAIQIKLEELNSLTPSQIVENEKVEDKFIQMYNAIHGVETGIQIYNKEKFNFQKLLNEKPELATCSKLSLYGSFLDMAVNGLSLDPTGRPHCYIIPRSVKTGAKDQNNKDIYEKRASVMVTGYGEIVMRMRAGQIKYVDNPVVVYEGDEFEAGTRNGSKFVNHSAKIPRTTTKIVACYVKITRNDNTTDFQWLMEGDILRLQKYSEKSNSKWVDNGHGEKVRVDGDANELYKSNGGQIDPGFLENKMIKHAFDSYPKVRTGQFTVLQTVEEDKVIDYGIEETEVEVVTDTQQSFDTQQQNNDEKTETVTIPVTEDDNQAGF